MELVIILMQVCIQPHLVKAQEMNRRLKFLRRKKLCKKSRDIRVRWWPIIAANREDLVRPICLLLWIIGK